MNHFLPRSIRAQRGLTLLELLIAITVGIFLVGGILAIVQSTRRTFGDQNQLAQLQDNERLALSFMTDIIESAGYYPNPRTYSANAVLPAVAVSPTVVFGTVGQAIYGTTLAGQDAITSRFGAGLNDNVFNCMGKTNTSIATFDTFVNTFAVVNQQLTCTFISNATPATTVVLVDGVQSLTALYGVKRNPNDTGSCTDTYLTAAQVADWTAVCSVMVTLTFLNPLIPAQPISITRVMAVMSTAGVNS